MSQFLICISRADGAPVYLYPGSRGEQDLVTAIIAKSVQFFQPVVEAIIARGVGFFRTEAQVRTAIEAELKNTTELVLQRAINAVLLEMKSEVIPTQV